MIINSHSQKFKMAILIGRVPSVYCPSMCVSLTTRCVHSQTWAWAWLGGEPRGSRWSPQGINPEVFLGDTPVEGGGWSDWRRLL